MSIRNPKEKIGSRKSTPKYVLRKSHLRYTISKRGLEAAKNKTFSISKPFMKRKYPFQNIEPVIEKLIQYGLDQNKIKTYNISKNDKTHARIKLKNCELSLVYLFDEIRNRYWLEIMVQKIKSDLSKKEKNAINKIVNGEDIKEYKTIKALYSDIVKLEAL
jgi:hypothetical protein